jgi:hypothetical protein
VVEPATHPPELREDRSPCRAGDRNGVYVGRLEAAAPPARHTMPRAACAVAAVVEAARPKKISHYNKIASALKYDISVLYHAIRVALYTD